MCREIRINKYKSSIYRIVDFYGEIKNKFYLYDKVSEILIQNKIEYIDFLCLGFERKSLARYGFFKKIKNKLFQIFFEPFIKK